MLRLTILVLGVLAQQTFADEPEAIVGGTAAKHGEFPHQCSLQIRGSHICGGSIISATKVLTAAHCLQGVVPAPYNGIQVVTGSIDNRAGKTRSVHHATVHPNYMDGAQYSWENDIAVITLQEPIQFDSYHRAIPLATSLPAAGTPCTLSGWGMTKANGPIPRFLLKMDARLTDRSTCQNALRQRLTGSHVCAFAQYGIGACQGDSGGPLICGGQQIGVTSFVLPCALGVPDVYTSVHHHLGFIKSS